MLITIAPSIFSFISSKYSYNFILILYRQSKIKILILWKFIPCLKKSFLLQVLCIFKAVTLDALNRCLFKNINLVRIAYSFKIIFKLSLISTWSNSLASLASIRWYPIWASFYWKLLIDFLSCVFLFHFKTASFHWRILY
jgi:hypothetical protein